MSETSFTPGPWTVDEQKGRIRVADGHSIIYAEWDFSSAAIEWENDDDKTLVAAAPDLYAALAALLNDCVVETGRTAAAEAALKKARGEG